MPGRRILKIYSCPILKKDETKNIKKIALNVSVFPSLHAKLLMNTTGQTNSVNELCYIIPTAMPYI